MIYQIYLFRFLIVLLQNLIFLEREIYFTTKGKGYLLQNTLNFYFGIISIPILIYIYLYSFNLNKLLIYFIISGNIFILLGSNYDYFVFDLIYYTFSELWAGVTIALSSWNMINIAFKEKYAIKHYKYFIISGNIATLCSPILYQLKINLYLIVIISFLCIILTLRLKNYFKYKSQKKKEESKTIDIDASIFFNIAFLTLYIILSIKIFRKNLYDFEKNLIYDELISSNQLYLAITTIIFSYIFIKNFEVNHIIFVSCNIIFFIFSNHFLIAFWAPIIVTSLRYSILDRSFELLYTRFNAKSQNIIKIGIYIIISKLVIFLSSILFTYFNDYLNVVFLTFTIIYIYNISILNKLIN